jgi:hypothetical protein
VLISNSDEWLFGDLAPGECISLCPSVKMRTWAEKGLCGPQMLDGVHSKGGKGCRPSSREHGSPVGACLIRTVAG